MESFRIREMSHKRKKVINLDVRKIPKDVNLKYIFPFLNLEEIVTLWTTNNASYNDKQFLEHIQNRIQIQEKKRIDAAMSVDLGMKFIFQNLTFKEEIIKCLSLMYQNIPAYQHNTIFDQCLFQMYGITPLILYCTNEYADFKIVKKMLTYKNLQLVPDNDFSDPMILASDTSEFVNHWIWEHQTALYQAVHGRQYNIVQLLLDSGAIVDNDTISEKIIKIAVEQRGKLFAKTLLKNSPKEARINFIKRFRLFF